MIQRVLLLILDSVGIGELPDARKYNDEGSNTLGNMAEAVGGLNLPNLQQLGLNIGDIKGVPPTSKAIGSYGQQKNLQVKIQQLVTGS